VPDAIYLIRDGKPVEMRQQPYKSEALLQELLEKYPDVLAGDQIDHNQPRRWLLVTREAPVPAEEDGAGRWSVDHLFLDQDAIPTIVEVKRSSDTRIRREVVGQMLDYAANGVVYWPAERLRSHYESNCQAEDRDPEEWLQASLGDVDQESFWQQVKTNLQAGKVRLVFVADEIPAELRRIIEFLNGQMDPAEVLGVEIRQYVGEGLQTLVPKVIGQTAEATAKKGQVERGPRWDEKRFFEELSRVASDDEISLARDLMAFGVIVAERPLEWGTGKFRGTFTAKMRTGRGSVGLFSVYTQGAYTVNICWYDRLKNFDDGRVLLERYRAKGEEILGFDILDSSTWDDSANSTMSSLSALLPDRAAGFKDFARGLAADIKSLSGGSVDL